MRYCLCLLILASYTLDAPAQTVLTEGQIQFIELSFNNVIPAWDVKINDENTNIIYSATFESPLNRFVFDRTGGARFRVAGPQHLFTRPPTPDWNFTGVAANQLFRATPQNGDTNTQLVMGIASTGVSFSLFEQNQFTVTMSTAGISNPGQFAFYGNDGTFGSAVGFTNPAPILLSTNDNITSFIYTGGTQNFFNLSFSTPGIYDIDLQFSGNRTAANGGGTITSEFYRYRFDIAAIPEPTTWALLGLCAVSGGLVCWNHRRLHRKKLDKPIE
jgi:hypothetical protein